MSTFPVIAWNSMNGESEENGNHFCVTNLKWILIVRRSCVCCRSQTPKAIWSKQLPDDIYCLRGEMSIDIYGSEEGEVENRAETLDKRTIYRPWRQEGMAPVLCHMFLVLEGAFNLTKPELGHLNVKRGQSNFYQTSARKKSIVWFISKLGQHILTVLILDENGMEQSSAWMA